MSKIFRGSSWLSLVAFMIFTAGCIFAPKPSPDPPPRPKIEWPDMTSRDDVIRTLVLCYANPTDEALNRYEGLLHSQYYFYMHEDDVKPGDEPYMTLSEDIASTKWIFEYQEDLALSIPEEGSWLVRNDIDGDPCENCWDTTRQYYIRAQFPQFEGSIYQSPPERAFVTIVVAPDENDPSKWVIRAMYDIITN